MNLFSFNLSDGVTGLLRDAVKLFRKLPFIEGMLQLVLKNEVQGALKLLANNGEGNDSSSETKSTAALISIPAEGTQSFTCIHNQSFNRSVVHYV